MIHVDFNSIHGRYLTALERHADEPLRVGQKLTATDADGNAATVRVCGLDDGVALLRFYRETFTDGPQ